MIPNAETLRKIQVQHGVTGSFKDRPLADWLQKHNPKEDEYEKVKKRNKRNNESLCLRVKTTELRAGIVSICSLYIL